MEGDTLTLDKMLETIDELRSQMPTRPKQLRVSAVDVHHPALRDLTLGCEVVVDAWVPPGRAVLCGLYHESQSVALGVLNLEEGALYVHPAALEAFDRGDSPGQVLKVMTTEG